MDIFKSNIGLEKLDGKWKINNKTLFMTFPFIVFIKSWVKSNLMVFLHLIHLVSDFKKIDFLDLKVSLDSFEFNNQKLSDINILLE